MKNRKIIIITIVLVAAAGFVRIAHSRQWINWFDKTTGKEIDANHELKQLYHRYAADTINFDISGTIFLYDQENNNVLKEQAPFRHIKNGTDYFTQMSHQKTYVQGGLVVQLDTLNKFMIVSRADTSLQGINNSSVFPFEKFLTDTSDFKITATVSDRGAERLLTLHNELTPEVKSTSVYYSSIDYRVNKTEIEWWKEQGIAEKVNDKKCWLSSIKYIYNTASTFNVADEIAKIITIKDQAVTPSEKYKDYEITVRLADNF